MLSLIRLAGRVGGLLKAVPFQAWLAFALVAALAWAVWWHLDTVDGLRAGLNDATAAATAAKDDRDRWQARASRYRDDMITAIAEQAHAEKAVRELQAELSDNGARYRALQARIRQAPETDDGPVAPVLRDALEALQ